jgi:tetratricopeptide (TPR) repeat protein
MNKIKENKMNRTHNILVVIVAILLLIFQVTDAFSQETRKIPNNLDLSGGEILFSSSNFQSGIRSTDKLGTLVQKYSSIGKDAVSYGFAAKSDEAKFFIIGALYSEALAYLNSGQIDMAAKRLESIEKEFIVLGVPNSLYNYISKTRNILELNKYSLEALKDFLSLFQPIFEDYAKNKGGDKLTLFRAGSWLVDMSLTAAADNRGLIKLKQEQLSYFIKEMERMDAPKGVLKSLKEIEKVAKKETISDKDVENILKQVKKIQTILG